MKKSFTLLCVLCALLLIPNVGKATDYTIETIPAPATPVLSKALPFVPQTSTGSSVAQQLYLASELTALGATAGNITGITFYYGGYNNNTAVPSLTRTIKVYITEIATDSLEMYEVTQGYSTVYRFKFKNPGTSAVHEGDITTAAISAGEVKALSINFNKSTYAWDGSKNILLTVYDVTNTAYSSSEANLRFVLKTTEHARFVHYYWTAAGDHNASEYLGAPLEGMVGESFTSGSTGTAQDKQVRGHRFIPKTTFTITPSATPVVPSTPEDLAASSIGSTSASLLWSAVEGATSYNLYYSASAEGPYLELASPTTNSYNWTGLTANTTFYVKVAAVNATGSSDLSSYIYFTTLAPHEHDGITFEPWSNASAMPTSGDYYLANDVALDPYDPSTITLTGNLNLCLNGNTANLYGTKIVVPDDKTLAIYDNVGGGKITSYVASEVGANEDYNTALVVVKSGGTLVLKEGVIENTYDYGDVYKSYAVYSNGTFIMSGEPVINSNDADIYLSASGVITLSGALTNSEKYSVMKYSGTTLTSGWSTNMSGEDPKDYLISADDEKSVYLNGSEAALRTLLNLSESSTNSSISLSYNKVADVNLTRSLTSSQYNTFCLPFALSNAQLQAAFGAGYDLQEFVSSDLVDETLELNFNKVTALVAGKPYLLKPSLDVANPIFQGVTITATSPVDQTSDTYISFKGIYKPTELEGGNQNILFLGAENELFWPETTENLKGFRAYFEVKGGAAKIAKRARIINKDESTTGLGEVQGNKVQGTKFIENGQLFILYNGTKYNVQGQVIK